MKKGCRGGGVNIKDPKPLYVVECEWGGEGKIIVTLLKVFIIDSPSAGMPSGLSKHLSGYLSLVSGYVSRTNTRQDSRISVSEVFSLTPSTVYRLSE